MATHTATATATTTLRQPPHQLGKINNYTGGWLPNNPNERLYWCAKFIGKHRRDEESQAKKGDKNLPVPSKTVRGSQKYQHQSIRDLKDTIQSSAQLSMLFRQMFEEIPFSHRYGPTGNQYEVVNYDQLLECFDDLLTLPPLYNENILVALPFTTLLEWPMATRGGLAAFLHETLNTRLGAVLDEWGKFLMTDRSRAYIKNEPNNPKSWLSHHARHIMQIRDPKGRTFEELYECDPQDEHLGFGSWDAFFTRHFRPGVREPDIDPKLDAKEKERFITSGCESAPYAIRQKVKLQEEFWVKGQPYSLVHMLDSEEEAKKFAGGTVYQAFLSPLTYHRWHAPITGKITKIRLVEGSYFSISPINAFPDPEVFANTQSQAYLSSVATRAIIYLHNDTVGTMVMMPIGMVEVSTCEINPKILEKMMVDEGEYNYLLEEGESVTISKQNHELHVKKQLKQGEAGVESDRSVKAGKCVTVTRASENTKSVTYVPKPGADMSIERGAELGMFHFGGSTHCMVFSPDIQLQFRHIALPLDTEDNHFVPLNTTVAEVLPKNKEVIHEKISAAEYVNV